MKKILFILSICLFSLSLLSQSCLPEGITFTTQEQINNFQTDNPGCTEIEGDVTIGGWSEISVITNLNGLSVLTSIQGNLKIIYNDSLTTLTGLDNLTSVEGNVTIGTYGVDAMLGGIDCMGNPSLITLTGLDNLTYIGGNLNIYCNENLTDFTGLGNLTTIEGDLNIGHAHTLWIIGDVTSAGNEVITTLSGMENVSYIGGDLKIEGNYALTTLTGLNNEVIIGGDLSIKYNDTLSTCEVQSICDYIVSPNGSITIEGNAAGCNSQQEVEEACLSHCLPEGITFTTQAQIDNFQINYPGCTEIEGDVNISGEDIANLNGLNTITSINGDLEIYGTTFNDLSGLESLTTIGDNLSLGKLINIHPGWLLPVGNSFTSLAGLDNLSSIGGSCSLQYNDTLTSIDALSNLTSIGGSVWINDNPLLTSLNGFNRIVTIRGELYIDGNHSLINLTGFDALNVIEWGLRIGSYGYNHGNQSLTNLQGLNNLKKIIGRGLKIEFNNALKDLEGLNNLVSIGNSLLVQLNDSLISLDGLESLKSIDSITNIDSTHRELLIASNYSLKDLTGLRNLNSETIEDLTISLNPSLSSCEIQSICSYLVAPSGEINISLNAPGCNSQLEVKEACASSIIENSTIYGIKTQPNPFTTSTTIEYVLKQPDNVTLTIYNRIGQIVYQTQENQPQGKQSLMWNAEGFADGIYYYRLQVGDAVANGKMLKMR